MHAPRGERTELEVIEYVARRDPSFTLGKPASVRTDEHVVEHGHMSEESHVLEGAGDSAARDLVRRTTQQVDASERDRARRRLVEASNAIEARRLAGAIGPYEPVYVALHDLERDVCKCGDSAEADREPVNGEKGVRARERHRMRAHFRASMMGPNGCQPPPTYRASCS